MADLKALSDEELLALIEKSRSVTAGPSPMDAAKDFGGGLVQGSVEGAASVMGLPGDVESIARFGMDKLNVPLPRTGMPTSGEVKHILQSGDEPFYKPQGTAGKVGQSIGQFLPAAALPGGAVQRGLNVVAPALGAEAGEALTGGSPYGRAAGALVGGVAGLRGITPAAATPAHLQQVQNLEARGVKLTAGQRTGSKFLRWMEESAADMPMGGRMGAINNQQKEQFTRAVLREIGEDATRATPEVVDRFLRRVGAVFDRAAMNHGVPLDSPLLTELQQIWRRYGQEVPQAFQAPIVERVVGEIWDLAQNTQTATGPWYAKMRTELERVARTTKDGALKETVQEIRHALDDALERGMQITGRTADLQGLQEARRQYRNYIPVEQAITGAGAEVAEGLISPSQLRNAVVQAHGRRNYARGRGDLGEIARAGEAVMKPLPQSGTAPRQAAMGGFGLLAGLQTGDPAIAAATTMAPWAGGAALASRPVQAYMGNQLLAQPPRRGRQLMIDLLLARPEQARQ